MTMSVPFTPRNPHFESLVRESFSRQSLMGTLGASVAFVAPGEVHLELPFSPLLCQQNGFLHAGAISSIADSANGYAAFTLTEPESDVLTVEFKVNLMAPAKGERFVARGRVLRPGRTLTTCLAEVVAVADGAETPIAVMLSTIVVRSRPISL